MSGWQAAGDIVRLRATHTKVAKESAGQGAADPPAAMAAANQTVSISTMQDAEGTATKEDGAVMLAIPVWQQQSATTVAVVPQWGSVN